MAVEREKNWLGQQRVDVPHLREVESAARYDMDVLAGQVVAGGRAMVASGFTPTLSPTPIGQPATSLTLITAGGVLLHPLAAEAGTIHQVPSDRAPEVLSTSNARVSGSFTPSAVNYVGVDLRRSADDSTSDLVQFLDADTFQESPEDVPLARTLDYLIVISGQDFSVNPNLAPLLKVTTDSSGNVTAIQDAAARAFRLGSGGSFPDAQNAYPWPAGRTEAGDDSDFGVGDKAIPSLKDWMDAAMTRLWELGGGERWYSPTADRNVQMVRAGTTFASGEYFEWDGANLHWRGLTFTFDNSTAVTNAVADQLTDSPGLTDLTSGQCVYVDVERGTNAATLTPIKGSLATLGAPLVPGSRYVIAWRVGSNVYTRNSYFAVGTAFAVATTTALGVVKLGVVSGTPAAPVVFNPDSDGALTVSATGGGSAGVTATGNGLGAGVSATGGSSSGGGPGLIAAGQGQGAGAVVSGGPNGPGIVVSGTVPSGGAPGNIVLAQDGGAPRWAIDRVGFPAGKIMTRYEDWVGMVATVSTPGTLTLVPGTVFSSYGNSGAASSLTPSNTNLTSGFWDGPSVAVTSGTSNTNYTGLSLRSFVPAFTGASESYVFAMEWVAALTATVPGGNYVSMGLCNSVGSGMGAAADLVMFRADGGAFWKVYVVGATTVAFSFTTAVATTNNVGHRFRIEMHATGSPLATALGYPAVAFLVDGAVVYVTTGASIHFPASVLRVAFESFNSVGSATQFLMGPVAYGMSLGV
jgi:hypothetical protein